MNADKVIYLHKGKLSISVLVTHTATQKEIGWKNINWINHNWENVPTFIFKSSQAAKGKSTAIYLSRQLVLGEPSHHTSFLFLTPLTQFGTMYRCVHDSVRPVVCYFKTGISSDPLMRSATGCGRCLWPDAHTAPASTDLLLQSAYASLAQQRRFGTTCTVNIRWALYQPPLPAFARTLFNVVPLSPIFISCYA